MFKKFMFSILLFLGLSSMWIGTANGEGGFQAEAFPFTEMQIQVMPEFDYPQNWPKEEPSLLVGQYGTFVNKTGKDFSGEIEIALPVNEKNFQIYLVAEFPSDNQPEVQRPYKVDKDRGLVTWKPEKPIKNNESYRFVVEYYSNPITVKNQKSFTYEYKSQSDVDKLDIIIYAPLNSKNIKLEPKSLKKESSEYGEEIHYYQFGKLKSGTSSKIFVQYEKKDNKSTLSSIDTKQAPNDENHAGTEAGNTATDQVLNASKAGDSGTSDKRPIIDVAGATIIAIAVVIAGVFVFMGLRTNKNKPKDMKKIKESSKKNISNKGLKSSLSDQKKELRKKLLNGKIDQLSYEEELKKLI